jgi:hypothetical protein
MADATEYFVFVYLAPFQRAAKGLLGESDLQAIEASIIANPKVGATIAETGGVRKMRYALAGRGKSGGARIIYYFRGAKGRVYMITAYGKNQKENLSRAERHAIRQIVEAIEAER